MGLQWDKTSTNCSRCLWPWRIAVSASHTAGTQASLVTTTANGKEELVHSIHASTYVYKYVYIYMCIYMYTYIYICIVYIYIHTYIYVYTHIYTYIYIYCTYIYVCMYVCRYIYIYICPYVCIHRYTPIIYIIYMRLFPSINILYMCEYTYPSEKACIGESMPCNGMHLSIHHDPSISCI